MIQIELGKHKYKVVQNWDELTLEKAIAIAKLTMPETLKEYYETGQPDFTKFLEGLELKQRAKILPEYFGQILDLASNIPKEVTSRLVGQLRIDIYGKLLEWIVYGLNYHHGYKAKGKKSFRFKGTTYYLPRDKDDIFGKPMPAAEMIAGEFTEVADLEVYSEQLVGGKVEVLPVVIAILARPRYREGKKWKRESYDEALALRRAELFKGLPVSVAWEVDFFMTRYLRSVKRDTVSFLSLVVSRQLKQPR